MTRRAVRVEPEALALVLGAAGALWRWRLELALAVVLVGAQLVLAGLIGNVAAVSLLVAVVAGALAAPRTRRWLARALRAAGVRRAWWRAWTDCELPRVRAGRVSEIPAGELVRVRASRGSSLEHVERRAEELAVCLQAREVRVARDPDNAATGTVTLVRRDPLAGMGLGGVAAARRGSVVAVGADRGRRRRARRDRHGVAARAQRAARR